MLRLKDKDGKVFCYHVKSREGPTTLSNGAPRRDSAGNPDIDKQWCKVVFSYTVVMDREARDAFWMLWKKTDPVITNSGSTPVFSALDDEVFGRTTFLSCTFADLVECPPIRRLAGEQELYTVSFPLEFLATTFDTKRLAS